MTTPIDISLAAPIEVVASDGVGERLDRFLATRLTGYSRAQIQRWIALGAVTCEQRVVSAKTRLNGSEIILVEPQPREADAAFVAEPVDFPVLDEGRGYLVIDKQAGLVVHPGSGNWQGTLMNGLLFRYPALSSLPRAGIVHRLDKDTSGLLIVATDELARESLIGQLADRSLSRRYLAICEGTVDRPLEFTGAIGRDTANRLRMAVCHDGKAALTHLTPLAQGQLAGQAVTLVECRLATGRTHQIRVHLAHAGHPLIGDTVYGARAGRAGRQMLHAWRLELARPLYGFRGSWRSALPADFQATLAAAGVDPIIAMTTVDKIAQRPDH